MHCLVWMCLDVLFCTASIMHLCTISIDRYLSLRYPMRFGRNKTRKRVTVKIIFVWLLSIAMSLPLCLMYSKVSKIHKTQNHWPNHKPKTSTAHAHKKTVFSLLANIFRFAFHFSRFISRIYRNRIMHPY